MNDRLLDQLRGKAPPPAGSPVLVKSGDTAPDDEDLDEVKEGCCGYLRGIRDRAFAIAFRLLDNNPFTENPAGLYSLLSYCGWLRDATGFKLEYANGLKITVTGRGLLRVYERILDQRVRWLQEEGKDAIAGQADPEAPHIYAINVEQRAEGAE